MTRILIQRGSSGSSSAPSSSNQNRNSSPSSSSSAPSSSSVPSPAQSQVSNNSQTTLTVKDDELAVEAQEHIAPGSSEKDEDFSPESLSSGHNDDLDTLSNHELLAANDHMASGDLVQSSGGLDVVEEENAGLIGSSVQVVTGTSYPPPPPVPPPRPSAVNSISRRSAFSNSNAVRAGLSRRATGWPNMSVRISPTGSRPSSPRPHGETDGYNSSDEQNSCFGSSYDDMERERQFEIDIRRVKGLEVKKMLEDGNCLFRAVADQVYGDSEAYDLVRQLCIDYMERERDHFAQFITEGFTSYCKRKRRDKCLRGADIGESSDRTVLVLKMIACRFGYVYGNNVEIQAMSEMYNRPIHIYSYSTEPINIFHRSYTTDTPPIRLSYHHGNHYNSLVDPRRLTVGAGLGFSSLRGIYSLVTKKIVCGPVDEMYTKECKRFGTEATANIDKDQVKAAIQAQQDQQIDNALLAEGRFYSDLELTEKEMERMVIEASRSEYLASEKFKPHLGHRESSTSRAEPSSSGARSSTDEAKKEGGREQPSRDTVLSSSMQIVLSMGFSYLQAIEAYSIFGDDVDSMVCYLLETSNSSRRKGKATE